MADTLENEPAERQELLKEALFVIAADDHESLPWAHTIIRELSPLDPDELKLYEAAQKDKLGIQN